MTLVLIILHVMTAILLLGPLTVGVSMFPPQMLKASQGDAAALGASRILHRISATYGLWSVMVPVIGAAVMFSDWATYKSQGTFHLAIVLSIIAWALLFFMVAPTQKKAMAALENNDAAFDFAGAKKKLSITSGIFCLLWVLIALSMFV